MRLLFFLTTDTSRFIEVSHWKIKTKRNGNWQLSFQQCFSRQGLLCASNQEQIIFKSDFNSSEKRLRNELTFDMIKRARDEHFVKVVYMPYVYFSVYSFTSHGV